MTDSYVARLDQRLAHMRETARLAAAFYKGLIEEGVPHSEAAQVTAIYSIAVNQPQDPED